MTRVVVHAGGIATADGISGPVAIVIRNGTIERLEAEPAGGASDAIIIARDVIVAAGLIDLHTHGAAGAQIIDGGEDVVRRLAESYARHGVTAFLATVGGSAASIEAGIRAAVEYIVSPRLQRGARCIGIHLEGPFINPTRPGAFVPSTIIPPDLALLDRFADLADGWLRRITLAPEVPGMQALIRAAVERGIGCSAGHSAATAEQMEAAVSAGVRSVTHVFNAMPSLHHREPGLIGVALTDPRLIVELIADGVHVHPMVMGLLARAKGWEGIALVTDSIAAAELPDGHYHFEEQAIIVRGGEARLADGVLAGSTLTLDDAVRRFASATGMPWHQAHASASLVPARALGVEDQMGRIAPGLQADLVAFDADHRVQWTMVGGEMVHRA